jgi:DNA-binding response OmpR family regulator
MPAPAGSTVPRVLVVEGDRAVREWVSDGLRRAGFHVNAAERGSAAVASRPQAPDAMVIALDLPDAGGLDVCRALRALGVVAPALFLIVGGLPPNGIAGSGSSADDYVIAPFDVEDVVERVRRLLRRGGPGAAPARVAPFRRRSLS